MGRATAVRYLDLLALAVERRGWRCFKLLRVTDQHAATREAT